MTCSFEIEIAHKTDIPELLDFVLKARENMFPKLHGTAMPTDLLAFEQHYVQGAGCFLLARAQQKIIACIGYLPYDRRFANFDFAGLEVAEVVRLFVAPEYRRAGLASALYSALQAVAQQAGIEMMYLHTHPFLAGAVDFWQRQGFEVIGVDADPQWQTTHMQMRPFPLHDGDCA